MIPSFEAPNQPAILTMLYCFASRPVAKNAD